MTTSRTTDSRAERDTSSGLVSDAALLVAALAAGLGATRLMNSPGSARVVLPVLAAVTAGHITVSLVARLRRGRGRLLTSSVSGLFVIFLVGLWVSVPSATRYGLPTSTSLRTIVDLFDRAGAVIRSRPTPLPPTHGIVLCITVGAGLVAVLGSVLRQWALSRPRRSAPAVVALVPSFGLFAYTSLLSSGVGRVQATVAYLSAAVVFLVAVDRVPAPAQKDVSQRTGTVSGLAGGVLAIAVALVVAPALSGMRLSALPFTNGTVTQVGAPFSGGAPPTGAASAPAAANVETISLIDNLQAVLLRQSKKVMFTATTDVPTYWQVATLSTFTGSQWLPDPATAASALQPTWADPSRLTGALPVLTQPPPHNTYPAYITLLGFGGRLLPAAPSTVAISGPGTELVPGIGAIYTSSDPFASENITYRLLVSSTGASAPSPSGGPGSGTSGTASGDTVIAAQLAPYLALPSMPPGVVSLADQIAAGSVDPASRAEALVRWFRSGNYRYTVEPPQLSGGDPLSTFLFVTKAGFCQQFAAAYAVLARLIGLPTRLAVGFTAGTPISTTRSAAHKVVTATYRVTGADAHVWPEVYLGAQQGWVSFEPTPSPRNQRAGAGVNSGSPTTSPTVSAQSTLPTSAGSRLPAPALHGASTPGRSGHRAQPLLVYSLLGLAVLGAGTIWLLTRRRPWAWMRLRIWMRARREPGAAGPSSEVLADLEGATRALRRVGLGREPSETLAEHSDRVRRSGTAREWCETYESLSRLAERASYAPEPCSRDDATRARSMSKAVCATVGARGARASSRTARKRLSNEDPVGTSR